MGTALVLTGSGDDRGSGGATKRGIVEGSSGGSSLRIAHLTTVDLSLRVLLLPQLLAVLSQEGVAVGISAPGPFVAELEGMGIRHVPLASSTRSMNLWADLRAAASLWRILRRERFDVLHTHNPKTGIYGRIVGRMAGVPTIVHTTHGLYATPEDPLAKRAVVYLLEAVAARCSDAELVQNPEDLATLRRIPFYPVDRLRLLGNGVDLDRFDRRRYSPARREALRAALGVGADDIAVGTVARLVAEKGVPELLEAFRGLDPRYVLLIVGPDDPEKAGALPSGVIADAKSRGVRFLGYQQDVEDVYAALDIFTLPSHREGLPRAAIEASSMSLPIVATDVRGCRDVVADGVSGLLVPIRDPQALRQALQQMGEDPERRESMGGAGRARAETLFDERAVVATVLDTYRAFATTRPRRWYGRARARRSTPRW